MNNYQTQQMFNDLNSIIGFTMSIIAMGFMIGMVKPIGRFFEPARRPEKHLPRPVVKEVTVPGGSYWKCSSCGKELLPGTKVFKAGKEVYCSISCIKLPEHHSSSNITTQEVKGTCYKDAWRFLIKEEEGELIHGSVQLVKEGARVNHAWVELPTGYIWEPQTKQYFTIKDFGVLSPIEEHRYSVEEAAIMLARVGKHGPWTDEERARWLEKRIVVKEIDMDDVFRFEATHIDFPYARGKVVLVSEPNYCVIVGLNVEKPIQRTGVGSTLIMKALEKAKLIGKPVIIEKVTPSGNALLESMESRGLIKLTLAGEKVDVQADIGEMVDVGGGKSISASYRIEMVKE